ncbi:hypothetical protein BC827DRAFT_1218341 [Russula dissimulans]|nr:hypothetical protein BC827DRAFT_1218341 [Russula dissimulans]
MCHALSTCIPSVPSSAWRTWGFFYCDTLPNSLFQSIHCHIFLEIASASSDLEAQHILSKADPVLEEEVERSEIHAGSAPHCETNNDVNEALLLSLSYIRSGT